MNKTISTVAIVALLLFNIATIFWLLPTSVDKKAAEVVKLFTSGTISSVQAREFHLVDENGVNMAELTMDHGSPRCTLFNTRGESTITITGQTIKMFDPRSVSGITMRVAYSYPTINITENGQNYYFILENGNIVVRTWIDGELHSLTMSMSEMLGHLDN